ncbi:Phosphate-repressible phosphate permease pho-4 [Smittium culicis]|nr:Phosphate-repressible phosphate permease pho-4 [Smittium culicis]
MFFEPLSTLYQVSSSLQSQTFRYNGYNVMRPFGNKITIITQSRGFSAELCTSLVVVTALGFGIHVSTTRFFSDALVGEGL